MRGFGTLYAPISACIRFIDDNEAAFMAEILDDSRLEEICFVYLKCPAESSGDYYMNRMGDLLKLDHRPYKNDDWIRLADDLGTEAYRIPGLVIIIDNAREPILKMDRIFFDFLESLMVQFHHWQKSKKPFHVCINIGNSDHVEKYFMTHSGNMWILLR